MCKPPPLISPHVRTFPSFPRPAPLLRLTLATLGSAPDRSNMGEPMAAFDTDSGPRLTRRLSFSNWSMDSWRTIPRKEPSKEGVVGAEMRWVVRTSCERTCGERAEQKEGRNGTRDAPKPLPTPKCGHPTKCAARCLAPPPCLPSSAHLSPLVPRPRRGGRGGRRA